MNQQADFPQRRLDLGGAIRGGEIVKRRVILERFSDGEKRIVTRALRCIGESGRNVMTGDLLAKPADGSFVGSQQAGETQEQRRFPGARSTDEPYYFASMYIERHIAQRGNGCRATLRAGVISLGECSHRQCELHSGVLRLEW